MPMAVLLGVDIGSVSISVALVSGEEILRTGHRAHGGKVREALHGWRAPFFPATSGCSPRSSRASWKPGDAGWRRWRCLPGAPSTSTSPSGPASAHTGPTWPAGSCGALGAGCAPVRKSLERRMTPFPGRLHSSCRRSKADLRCMKRCRTLRPSLPGFGPRRLICLKWRFLETSMSAAAG